jgi:cell division protein FtsN
MTRRPAAVLALSLLLAGPAAAAPLDDALKELTERFRLMADAYGLTAEVYIRCSKKDELAKQIRASLEQAGARLQKESGTNAPLHDVANRAFTAGRNRGKQLLCSEKPEEFADQMRAQTRAKVNETIARINDLKTASNAPAGQPVPAQTPRATPKPAPAPAQPAPVPQAAPTPAPTPAPAPPAVRRLD